jgi:predicted adenylyl cyclase CyaB
MIEKELKFKISEGAIGTFKRKVKRLDGVELMPRTFETTSMYDDLSGLLQAQDARLRLRNGYKSSISYKRPISRRGVKREIEFETVVLDCGEMKKILQSLGFRLASSYGRHRTIWKVGHVKIFLDEFSFGTYVEIEGSILGIQKIAKELDFSLKNNLTGSYDGIYKSICEERGIKPKSHFK